jgi:soluble lytic murein transglycosylase-like protein
MSPQPYGRWRPDLCLATLVLGASACAPGGSSAGVVPVSPLPVANAPSDSASRREAHMREAQVPPPGRPAHSPVRARMTRVPLDSTALEFAVTARLAHRPLALALARRTRNPDVAERAAWAVTREAGRLQVSPSLLAAVLLVENRALDSSAVSSQGAIGLMQVMPVHAGGYGCGSPDLLSVDANICHGARLLHIYLLRTGSVSLALRRYNGCVRGTNTPRCYRYPGRVLRTASRLRREMLATAAGLGVVVPAAEIPRLPGRVVRVYRGGSQSGQS